MIEKLVEEAKQLMADSKKSEQEAQAAKRDALYEEFLRLARD